jgi:SAM-dependent methyltransferase
MSTVTGKTATGIPSQREGLPKLTVPASPAVRHGAGLLRQRLDRLTARAGAVVGCGRGDEVVFLQRELQSPCVIGLDVAPRFSPAARAEAKLVLADAKQLPFPASSFDFVVSIHSLEHVGDPHRALAEVKRVLRPGGWFYVGVPNRHRLVGYLGSFDATLWQKLIWNLLDYSQRLRGRFKNELGAHAGFTSQELVNLLDVDFTNRQLLTGDYVRFKYEGRLPRRLLNFLLKPMVMDYSVPAHYALCQKK